MGSTNEKSTRAHGASCATQLSLRLSASNCAQEQCAELILQKRFIEKNLVKLSEVKESRQFFLEILWWFDGKNRVEKDAIKSQKTCQKTCCRKSAVVLFIVIDRVIYLLFSAESFNSSHFPTVMHLTP